VKYQRDDRFGGLDLSIENNGYTLVGRYYTNDGVKRDTFKIFKSGPLQAQYNFGPSLTLSGEDAQAKNGQDSSKELGQVNGKGKGLDCEHFTQQGPLRCR
jgi:hypothetical protein